MAATFTSPQALPVADELQTGQVLRATPAADLAGALNHFHARGRAEPQVSESWGTPLTVDAGKLTVLFYRLPFLSTGHLKWRVVVDCEATVDKGTLYANAGGAEVSADIDVGRQWVEVEPVGAYSNAGAVVSVAVENAVGGSVKVFGLSIVPVPLTSALATAAAGDFSPMGVATLAADRALSAARGQKARKNIAALLGAGINRTYARVALAHAWPQVTYADTGDGLYTDHTTNTGTAGARVLVRDLWGCAPVSRGDGAAGVLWRLYYYLVPPGAGTVYTRLVVAALDADGVAWPGDGQVYEVKNDSGDAEGWYWEDIAAPDAWRTLPQWPSHAIVGLIGQGRYFPDLATTARLKSVALWAY